MTSRPPLKLLHSQARGQIPIEFALGVGLLVLPIAVLVLSLPTWAERQNMARLAAQEAARTLALASDWESGTAAAAAVVGEFAANHGLEPAAVVVSFDGYLTRGGAVTAHVTAAFPTTVFPGIGTVGSFSWTTSHTEHVDNYRSFG
ncbi:MAG: hypothetical protein M3276_07685 [Actinomycetota bacterium]|nr:hypothetical protein [Actinomycetota bacterium]